MNYSVRPPSLKYRKSNEDFPKFVLKTKSQKGKHSDKDMGVKLDVLLVAPHLIYFGAGSLNLELDPGS